MLTLNWQHKFNRLVSYLNGAYTPTHGCQACKHNAIDLDTLEELPTMFMTLMVMETTPFLHHWFERVEALDYPKDKLDVFVHNQVCGSDSRKLCSVSNHNKLHRISKPPISIGIEILML